MKYPSVTPTEAWQIVIDEVEETLYEMEMAHEDDTDLYLRRCDLLDALYAEWQEGAAPCLVTSIK